MLFKPSQTIFSSKVKIRGMPSRLSEYSPEQAVQKKFFIVGTHPFYRGSCNFWKIIEGRGAQDVLVKGT